MTTVVFYADDNCQDSVGNATSAPPTGACTKFGVTSFGSFRVETLERTCAVTIYDRDVSFCSSSTISVANFGVCYTNATVDQLSTDCEDFNIATSEPPASFIPAPTSSTSTPTTSATSSPATTTASSPSPTPSDLQQEPEGLSTGAKAGIGIASALAVLAVIGVILFFFFRKRRRTQAHNTREGSVQELHGSSAHPVEISWERDKRDFAMTDVKHQRYPSRTVVEAPGDTYWPGRMHEMDAASVRSHDVSSPTGCATNLSTNTQSLSRVS